ncbi:unnamed protein product [Schistocephalus solidus]|uniref:Tick transposon n=1 Tax=Schistocephalus solidus TaxID=70667 RepID=A0A183T4Y4_SCHSO|nr:unnamed protein product [Schistocephalus solidus]
MAAMPVCHILETGILPQARVHPWTVARRLPKQSTGAGCRNRAIALKSNDVVAAFTAELFQFRTDEADFNQTDFHTSSDDTVIEDLEFTEGDVKKEFLAPNDAKSPSPDQIPAKVLKKLAGELS